MARAVVEPFPHLRAILLPASASWIRQGNGRAPELRLRLSSASDTWNSAYLATLDTDQTKAVRRANGYRSLAMFDPPKFEAGLASFVYVREAAAALARKAGAHAAGKHRAAGEPDFDAAMASAGEYGYRLGDWVARGLALPSGHAPDATFTGLLASRFTSSFMVAYVQYAYAVPRGVFAAPELDTWPHIPTWDGLQLNRHPEGARALYHAPFAHRLMSLHPREIRGYENGSWQMVKSWIWDARSTIVRPKNAGVATFVNESPLLWAVCQILGDAIRTAGGDPLRARDAVAAEMQDVITKHATPAPPPPLPGRLAGTPPPPITAGPVARTSQRPPKPAAHPYGVSPRGAEQLCCDWMHHMGILDARTTQYSSDGGIDVTSAGFVAQVKHYTGAVGGPDVQRLIGAAYPARKTPLFFTSGRYTAAAEAAAATADVALFVYSAERGTLNAANHAARALIRSLS